MQDQHAVRNVIENLFKRQKVGVLATQSDQYPYCNLIAFTPDNDLRTLLFTTPRGTQKYRNLMHSPHAAFLVDNRLEAGIDFGAGIAVTALGTVAEVPSSQRDALKARHGDRHVPIKDFINAPDSALCALRVSLYIVVSGVTGTATLAMR